MRPSHAALARQPTAPCRRAHPQRRAHPSHPNPAAPLPPSPSHPCRHHHHHQHHDDAVTSVSISIEGDMDLDKVGG